MAKGLVPVFKLHAMNYCKDNGDKAPVYFPCVFIICMEINDSFHASTTLTTEGLFEIVCIRRFMNIKIETHEIAKL
jgi:hypothetical protein